MKAYSIKEVSELTGISQGTIRQWDNDFKDVFFIPRDEKNARYFTDIEIEGLKNIKAMRDKNLSIEVIKDLLKKRSDKNNETIVLPKQTLPILQQSEATQTLIEIRDTLERLPEVKKAIVSEIRDELKEELSEVVRKEINETMNNKNNELLKLLQDKESQKKTLWQRIFGR